MGNFRPDPIGEFFVRPHLILFYFFFDSIKFIYYVTHTFFFFGPAGGARGERGEGGRRELIDDCFLIHI